MSVRFHEAAKVEVVKRIVQHPYSGPPSGRHRRIVLPRFPFTLKYSVEPDRTIFVLALVHQRRRPGRTDQRKAPSERSPRKRRP